MLKAVSGWILLLLSFNSLALTQTRLLQVSTSGQTLVFDAGVHERLKENEFGVVLKQVKSLNNQNALRVVPVGKVRNVKVGTDHSVWVLFDLYQEGLLQRGDVFTLFTESNMLPGRRPYEVKKLQVVSSQKDVKAAARSSLEDESDRLAKVKNYKKSHINHSSSYKSDEDFELIELEKWSRHKERRFRTGLYRSQNAEQFKRNLRLEVFEGLVTQYLQRVNDPDFNYATFYDKQMREPGNNFFRQRSNFATAWENNLAYNEKSIESNAKLSRSLLENGERWSEDYSDEELGLLLGKISIAQEKDRRARVISKPSRFHMAVDYSKALSDNQTSTDTNYQKSSRYSISAELEFVPMVKHPLWERFAINAQGTINDDAVGLAGKNFDRNDQSFTMGLNWFPFFAPYAEKVINIYLGTYFRAGYSKMRSSFYDEKANYTLMSIPAFRAGLRYTFRNKVSLRMVGSIETASFEKSGSSVFNSSLPSSFTKTDMNLAFGLGYSF